MNEIQLQQKHIYDRLNPLFREHGYTFNPDKNQFVLPTRNGFRTALVSVSGDCREQTVDLRLGIRIDVIEELANQFMTELNADGAETTTLLTSYGRLNREPHKKFMIKNEPELEETCKRIGIFMHGKGFRFLEKFDRIRKLDALLNRKTEVPCPLLLNQINRCFKGTVMAKLTHRTDFNRLVKNYLGYLQKQWMPQEVITNYKKLVKFMRFYSIN